MYKRCLIVGLIAVAVGSAAAPADPVDVPDAALRQCLEKEFDKEAGATITESDMATLGRLYCDRREGRVADISGLEFAVNLDDLVLVGSNVSDLSPLADLASLTQLWLGANAVEDVSPLTGLRSLTHLDLGDNELEDVSDLRRLTSLTYLGLYSNDIEDVSALRGMTSLAEAYLAHNRISDISDLAANDGLGQGDQLDLTGNPLDADAHATHIPELQERGVAVYFDPPTDPVVAISDRALRRCFEQALDKERGAAIAESEVASLTSLTCRNAGVDDLSGLEEAVSLTKLELDGNEIEDVDALGELESLLYVGLRDNSIADIEALADNRDFGSGDYIELRGNPLNAEAHSRHIPALERRGVTVSYDPSSPPVTIADPALRQCLEGEFDKEAGETITEDDLATLDRLYCDRREGRVADISGLEFAVNLDDLVLVGSNVSDLSPLADLASLTQLWLGANAVEDVSPLTGLRSLTHLDLGDNELEDVSDLRRLTSLTYLGLYSNDIEDVSALRLMSSLAEVYLANNRISDISDLAANDGLGRGDYLELQGNPLDADAHATHIPALLERGVTVHFDPPADPVVEISDRALRRCFEQALDKERGAAITESEAASLTSLTCRNAGVVDLSGLEEAVSLTRLELDGNEIEDVDALGELEALRYVGLRDNSIEDIEALADNRAFGDGDHIELRGNPLDAEAHSRHIPALERRGVTVSFDPPSPPVTIADAALRHCLEEELDKDAGATITEDDMAALEQLFCKLHVFSDGSRNADRSPHGPVASLAGLEFASNLVELRLQRNIVDDLSPLAELASLSVLRLGHNRVTDIAPLAELPLTYLDLAGNTVSDLSPLARLASLRELAMTGSGVSDLSPLAGLPSLIRLWLGANAVTDVSPLAGLGSLTHLNLGANAIEDVSSLGELTSLVYLGLYSNAIADVSALRAMTSLREAYLANNRISDISALVANDGLAGDGDHVDLLENPIACGAQAEQVKLLRDRGVNVYADEADLALPVFAASPGNRFVELRWSKPAGCHVNRYQYRHGIGKSPEFGQWRNIGDGAATGRTVDDLANGQLHVFELRMVGSRGPGPAKRVYVALAEEPDTPVEIVDAELSTALAEALGIGAESEQPADSTAQDQSGGEEEAEAVVITRGQLATLTDLDIGARGIANLRGLEYAVNLRSLSLAGNAVESLSPVADLQLLVTLDASANGISDVSSLTEASLPGLKALILAANDLADISALRHLQGLTDLALDGNEIVDVTALTTLTALQRLWLNDNAIVDIAPLAANEGLGQGEVRLDGSSDYVDLRGNPLSADALGVQAAQLRQRGAALLADDGARLVPFFAQGGDPGRLSVLRIVNPTDQASEASLTAIDDAGLRLGPVTLAVGARKAVHLDSNDLENGNAELGLSAGVGTGSGDWRLELRSAAPLQTFSYMRGADGVTTSMNALVPETYAKHRVSMFKAAGLASRLRVINATAKAARVLIEGVDDAGATASVAVEVPIGATRNFTAATLEGGRGTGFGVLEGGLGNGTGDWRLTATSYDGVQVLNLLGSAGGNWVNLSAEPFASEGDAEHLPLFLSEIASQGAHGQSVARIVNRSARSGQVTIRAVDAQGRAYPAGALALAAGRTVKFNSTELEQGDAERGLTGLTASGVDQGNWRLLLTSDLDIRASAYIEASDGLFGSFHECVSVAAATADAQRTHEVPLFNSAGHADGASRLRLINSAAAPANVRIRGIDDAGRPGVAVVRLAIPAGATRELTASDLETGEADGVSGALGDGGGKWRLWVESDAPIEVMNLVETANGHLSNLSR